MTFGPITDHRLRVVLNLIAGVVILYALQVWIWPVSQAPQTLIERIWSWGTLVWVGPTVFGTFGLVGMLIFRYPLGLDNVQPIRKLVSWRIVSRGINVDVLLSTIYRCREEMAKTPLFPYVIEVVTDSGNVQLPKLPYLKHITVPGKYTTLNNSLFKARALHFALEKSSLPDDAWIVHLDEETQPTPSGIKGICAMIREEEAQRTYRIGQGAILYHRTWEKYPLLTLADNVRTGVDFAQFHLQHRLGLSFFGFHGSYIVVRNAVEKSIGFDFGPQGSITEDAFWALVAMQKGYRSRWVDGYLEEQSTQSVGDFIRQRRRWIQGLTKVSLYAPVQLRWRVALGFNTLIWNLGPFATLYTLAHFFYGFQTQWWVLLLANFSFSSYELIYLMGLKANLDEFGITDWFKRAGWYLVQIALFPFFSLMEALGILAAVFRPVPGFHVVRK